MKHEFSIRNARALFIFIVIAAVLWVNSPNLFATSHYVANAFENIHAAVSAVGQKTAVLLLMDQHKISTSLVVPANITLRFQGNASLLIEKDISVSIESPIQAPLNRVFSGEGKVVLKGSVAFPHWWGARGDGTQDDGYAIQSAIDSVHAGGGGVVHLPMGRYLLNHVTEPYYVIKGKNKVSIIGEGNQSILRVGDHLRQSTRGVAVLYNHEELVSKCRYAQFSVDYNGKNNPRLAAWGKDAKVSNVSRMGADFASDLIVEGIHFKEVSGGHCIWIGNHQTNFHNIIRNCVFSNVGQSVFGNQITDHSSIYMGGVNGLVSGNSFSNLAPCNISTAIEIHSSNTVVSNNNVVNYSTAVNIGGEANHCSNVALTNNSFKNSRNGIVFWHYSPYQLKNITVSGNTISVRETDSTPYPPSAGIIYGSEYVTSKTNMSNLKISNNTIFQETTTIPNQKPNTGIHVEGVDDLGITGNTIYDFNGEAIYIQSRSKEQGMSGIIISGNFIKNVGLTSTQSRKRAIVFNSYPTSAGAITDVLLQNNEIVAGEKLPMLAGIVFNKGSFPKVEIRGNFISGTTQFEIINNSTDQNGFFLVDHSGRGTPVNNLRASKGSRWVDVTNNQTYIIPDISGSGSSYVDWVLKEK